MMYIALAAPLSGPLSKFGTSMLRGGRMRIDEIKHQRLWNGMTVRLIALNDRGRPQEAARLANNMGSHQSIVAVIGHLTTGCTLAAASLYDSARMVLVSPVATGDDLATITTPYMFRTIPSDSEQAASLASHLHRTLNTKKVALIYKDSPLGNRLRASFLKRGEGMGLSVKDFAAAGPAFSSLNETIRNIILFRATAIFLAGGPRFAALLVRKWPEHTERPLTVGTHILISEEFTELAGRHAHGTLAAHPCVWASDFKKGNQTRDRYEKKFKYVMDWPAIQTYDAVDLALWAVRKSGSDRSSMRSVLSGRNSRHRSLPGLAGPIYFNRDGSLAREVTVAVYTKSGWKVRKR